MTSDIGSLDLPALDSPSYDKRAVADFFSVSPRTVDRLVAANAIGFTRVGRQLRFSRLDLITYLAKNGVPAMS